jgi:hypothetical protein
MKIRWNRFNIYLVVGLTVCLLSGCKTEDAEHKKQLARIQLYAESNPDPGGRTKEVQVYREHPVTFTVERDPFLTESNVKHAEIVDALGGFAFRLEFNKEGSWLLEEYTSGNRGRHIVIFTQWENKAASETSIGRWLAAPTIHKHVADGILIFTPDATREEAEKITLGLNNVAKMRGTDDEFQ